MTASGAIFGCFVEFGVLFCRLWWSFLLFFRVSGLLGQICCSRGDFRSQNPVEQVGTIAEFEDLLDNI